MRKSSSLTCLEKQHLMLTSLWPKVVRKGPIGLHALYSLRRILKKIAQKYIQQFLDSLLFYAYFLLGTLFSQSRISRCRSNCVY